MIKDAQVRRLRQLLGEGHPLYLAAMKVGMDAKTARKYRHADRLPSESFTPRPGGPGRTRSRTSGPNSRPARLNPGLQAKTLFDDLQRRFPGRFPDVQLRSLQRQIKPWRALEGPAQGGLLRPGPRARRLAASDFTCMAELGVTIAGEPFDHLVYHFVLTYSNWEAGTRLLLRELREPQRRAAERPVGTGRSSPAAPHRSPDRRGQQPRRSEMFPQRYRALLAHYGLKAQAIQPRKANENGDVEQSHHRFKQAVDQALMLRGSRDFAGPRRLRAFLRKLMAGRNASRKERSPRNGRAAVSAGAAAGAWQPVPRRGSSRGARSASTATPTRCPAD